MTHESKPIAILALFIVCVAIPLVPAPAAADELTIVVVETSTDPNAKTNTTSNLRNLPRGGIAVRASTLDEAEGKIIGKLGTGDCIKRLDFRGHGAPGVQGVGDGVGYDGDKHINTGNQSKWTEKLEELEGRFCENAVVNLWGCNVGSCTKGAEKLKAIADRFNVTARGAVDTVSAGKQERYKGPIQEAKPDRPAPQCMIATIKKAKKKEDKIDPPAPEQAPEIVSPLTYAPFLVGQPITFKIGAYSHAHEVKWRVSQSEAEGSGDSFTFVPSVPGNFHVTASFEDKEHTVIVLVRSGEIEPEPWTQVDVLEPMEGFTDLLGFRRIQIDHSGPADITTESPSMAFLVGQPVGSAVSIHVEAPIANEEGHITSVYEAELTVTFERSTLQVIEVPLVPDTVNEIRFQGFDEKLGNSSPVFFTLAHVKPLPDIPVVFQKRAGGRETEITGADLRRALRSYINNAKNVSRELAAYLNDVVLAVVNKSGTDRRTARIRIKVQELLRLLRLYRRQTDPEKKAKMEEELKREYVNLLLHEAGHAKAVRRGVAGPSTPENTEEMRNRKEMINRLIDLLGRLKEREGGAPPTKAPDGAGLDNQSATTWLERIRYILFRQAEQIQKYLRRTDQEFKRDEADLSSAYRRLQRDLRRLNRDNSKTQAQKRTEGQRRFDRFKREQQARISRLADKCGKEYYFTFYPATRFVKKNKRLSRSFNGKPIPQ